MSAVPAALRAHDSAPVGADREFARDHVAVLEERISDAILPRHSSEGTAGHSNEKISLAFEALPQGMVKPAGFDCRREFDTHDSIRRDIEERRARSHRRTPAFVNRVTRPLRSPATRRCARRNAVARRSQRVDAGRVPLEARRRRRLALDEPSLNLLSGKGRRQARPGKPSTDDDDVENPLGDCTRVFLDNYWMQNG